MLNETDLRHLRRCVELATEALAAGDEPFGSVLVAGDGRVRAGDPQRVAPGDQTPPPEFEQARGAALDELLARPTASTAAADLPGR